jgi:Niemann-Pick C1 protein
VTSTDYIQSLKNAIKISDSVTKSMRDNAKRDNPAISQAELDNMGVFPYAIFYVFYDQYLTIWSDATFNLSISMAAILVVSIILLGFDFHTAFIVILTIGMITTNMFGAMYVLDIELNAVSLVNIVIVSLIGDRLLVCVNSVQNWIFFFKKGCGNISRVLCTYSA